jgi:hypothetical protein
VKIERPDLSNAAPEICAYIESLETEIARLQKPKKVFQEQAEPVMEDPRPSEPPTTINIITLSALRRKQLPALPARPWHGGI